MFRAVAPPLSDVTGPSEPPVNVPSGWERIAPLLVVAMIGGYALLFGWLSLSAYWAYSMHALDMGNMGQAAWNTIHGHLFAFTNMRLPYNIEAWRTTTRLSFHVEALFPVISLAYVVYPNPESLLIVQTVAIALGAVPTYLLARDVLHSTGLALVFALAYLLYPTVEALNLYEFHPVSLATPLLLFAFLFAYRHQYVPFLLCSAAAMGTKEEIGLVVGMFGLYIAFVQKERRLGLLTFVMGFGWSLFAALVIEKHFRQLGTVTYMASRYGYLCGGADATGQVHCHGFHGPIHTVLHDPGAILKASVCLAQGRLPPIPPRSSGIHRSPGATRAPPGGSDARAESPQSGLSHVFGRGRQFSGDRRRSRDRRDTRNGPTSGVADAPDRSGASLPDRRRIYRGERALEPARQRVYAARGSLLCPGAHCPSTLG